MAKRKKRKALLPKRIAGVKVPKSVRKGRLGELLASQTGQALLAQAVLAAGAIGATKKAGDAAVDKASDAGGVGQRLKGGKDPGAAGAILAVALGEAARAFVKSLNQREREADSPDWAADEAGDSKKNRSSQPSPPH